MKIKFKADYRNHHKDIEFQLQKWLNDVLVFLEVDTNELEGLSRRKQIIKLIQEYKVEIIEHPGINGLEVRQNGECVGEAVVSEYLLKTTKSEKYYEIEIEAWSVLEEQINMS